MGVKYVSLKSTLSGFWVIWVGWSGLWVGSACRVELVDWFGVGSGLPYICGGRWSGMLDYILRAGLPWPSLGLLWGVHSMGGLGWNVANTWVETIFRLIENSS